ncbi:MAG TPA: hypothetical protein VK177_21515 [Flavobacteriales bacterium]|nr:hypothetical protein [Flavobacteriales bacterium]
MKIKALAIIGLFLLFIAFLSGCKKQEVKPVTQPVTPVQSSQQHLITVEYKVYAESGSFILKYVAPEANKLKTYKTTINRNEHVIGFDWVNGSTFELEAANVTASTKQVIVEIYINGILYSSAVANSPNSVASATATVY